MSTGKLWHTLPIADVTQDLGADPERGLTSSEARERLEADGPNEIEAGRKRTVLHMLATQFADVLILVLIAAALVSGLLGELRDTAVILVIVILNAAIGAVQEYRAEKALAALRQLAAPEARVRRDGRLMAVAGREVVAGDIVHVEAGDVVPADVRLVESHDLQVDEAALTGESLAVDKSVGVLDDPALPVGDRRNMAFKATHVTRGRALAVVVGAGMRTELGAIATLLQESGTVRTPLQKRLAKFSQRLAAAVFVIVAIIFVVGLLRGEELLLMFMTSVSLAVAAVPEALPAVITISLAVGARRMGKHQALMRRLPAVETLGSVTWVCSDKTGTLTRNEMSLEAVFAQGRRYAQLSELRDRRDVFEPLGRGLALCTDVERGESGELSGDPTEVALHVGASEAGFDKARLSAELPRIAEIAFHADRRRMTTLHAHADGDVVAFVKGAPEAVLPRCTGDHVDDVAEADALAGEGYRVLAIATRRFPELPARLEPDRVETDLELLGLVGLIDPPRREVPKSIQDCLTAGITPVMITGDHPGTAAAIARRLGIDDGGGVLTGRDLERLSPEELAERVEGTHIYARVDPEQKINIVRALQARGQFVAMTGDGVNDAPALKRADIGVAMGRKGTDVAREAADMVLVDDNFATIVRAVREGRRIFDNIRKFIKYTMTSNSGEIWTLFLAPFFGLPIPLLPVHILWVNLVTDGLPGLALAVEPQERGIMQRAPRPPKESIFAHGMWQHMVWVGLLIGALSIGSQAWAFARSGNWQTVVFTVLVFSQLVHATVIRSERESLLTIGLLSNLPLLGAVVLTVGLQLLVIYVPALNTLFRTSPLSALELAVCFIVPLTVFFAVEAEKLLARRGAIYRA